MSIASDLSVRNRIAVIVGLYGLAYLVASGLDLWTTELALVRPEASEGNVYATDASGYDPTRAWLITLVGGVVIGACLVWALRAATGVSEMWLSRPVRSFGKFYFNPWARAVRDRAPLHMISFVIAFVPLRLLAALNNALIAHTGTAPLGRLVGLASQATSPTVGFWLVLAPLFYLLAIAASPFAVRLIRLLRRAGE